ncbi:MAG: MFS transporter [Planctomycetaceae bacterium]|nr:MFS transporter [Planctomycetaceae bacterium]
MLRSFPLRYRPAICLESVYNFGLGPYVALTALSTVVLKSILDGNEFHLAFIGAVAGGSSLLSPLVTWLERFVSNKKLVVVPCLLMTLLLWVTPLTQNSATAFVVLMSSLYLLQAAPRVAEMNMFQFVYPITLRSLAVGWLKSIAGVCALVITLLGYLWFSRFPTYYWVVFCLVGFLLLLAALAYAFIPVRYPARRQPNQDSNLWKDFTHNLGVILSDHRFIWFQTGFAVAGFANHMSLIFVAEILQENVLAHGTVVASITEFFQTYGGGYMEITERKIHVIIVGLIIAVIPSVLEFTTAPLWGRWMTGKNPIECRLVVVVMQLVAFVCLAIGGITLNLVWFIVGISICSVAVAGGLINWLTGSLYFAPVEYVSLYNSTNLTLTGIRGLVAPLIGGYLLSEKGWQLGHNIFWVGAALLLVAVIILGSQLIYERRHGIG